MWIVWRSIDGCVVVGIRRNEVLGGDGEEYYQEYDEEHCGDEDDL
jgi:hypothetical protein